MRRETLLSLVGRRAPGWIARGASIAESALDFFGVFPYPQSRMWFRRFFL